MCPEPHGKNWKKKKFRRGRQCSDVLSSGIWEAEERWKTWFGSLPPVFVPKFLTPWLEAELRSFPRPRSARLCMSVVNLGAPEIHPAPPPCWRGEGKGVRRWWLPHDASVSGGCPSPAPTAGAHLGSLDSAALRYLPTGVTRMLRWLNTHQEGLRVPVKKLKAAKLGQKTASGAFKKQQHCMTFDLYFQKPAWHHHQMVTANSSHGQTYLIGNKNRIIKRALMVKKKSTLSIVKTSQPSEMFLTHHLPEFPCRQNFLLFWLLNRNTIHSHWRISASSSNSKVSNKYFLFTTY